MNSIERWFIQYALRVGEGTSRTVYFNSLCLIQRLLPLRRWDFERGLESWNTLPADCVWCSSSEFVVAASPLHEIIEQDGTIVKLSSDANLARLHLDADKRWIDRGSRWIDDNGANKLNKRAIAQESYCNSQSAGTIRLIIRSLFASCAIGRRTSRLPTITIGLLLCFFAGSIDLLYLLCRGWNQWYLIMQCLCNVSRLHWVH